MAITHILIDFENVQPEGLELLKNMLGARVTVFVGPGQKNVPVDKLVLPLQDLGERGKLVKVSDVGRNALDFHIAFTLGQLTERETNTCFRIISKDKGFDPLMAYLKGQGFGAERLDSIHAVFGLKKPAPSKPVASVLIPAPTAVAKPKTSLVKKKPAVKQTAHHTPAQICLAYIKMLKQPKATHPGTLEKLKNDIRAKNTDASAMKDVDAVVALLKNKRHIAVDDGGKVFYPPFPKAKSAAPEKQAGAPVPDTAMVLCQKVVDKLDKAKNPKITLPRTLKNLHHHIKATFPKENLSDSIIDEMISLMRERSFLSINENGRIIWATVAQTKAI
jgi:hypothetical protein